MYYSFNKLFYSYAFKKLLYYKLQVTKFAQIVTVLFGFTHTVFTERETEGCRKGSRPKPHKGLEKVKPYLVILT